MCVCVCVCVNAYHRVFEIKSTKPQSLPLSIFNLVLKATGEEYVVFHTMFQWYRQHIFTFAFLIKKQELSTMSQISLAFCIKYGGMGM